MSEDDGVRLEFIDQYKKLKEMKPSPCQLGKGNDGNYYWIYYAGMGEYAFHPVQNQLLYGLESLLKTGGLIQTDETATLPLYFEDNVRPATFVLYDLIIDPNVG